MGAAGIDLTLEQLETAWLRVEENAGCAGADGETVARFAYHSAEELLRLRHEILAGEYRPLPLLEMRLQKKPGSAETRRLLIPAVRDRVAQTAVLRSLAGQVDRDLADSSFAYRPGRGVDCAIARVAQLRDRGFCFAVRADIEAFFDHLSHAKLAEALEANPTTRDGAGLFMAWVRTCYWDGSRLHRLTEGIPQGSPLSPLFSNLFLDPFDAAMSVEPAHLVRYADDLLVLCPSAADAEAARERAAAALTALRLRLAESKTATVTFEEGFEFLGAFFLKNRVYLPWKERRAKAAVVFLARPMPAALIAKYLGRRRGRPAGRRSATRHHRPFQGAGVLDKHLMAFLYLTEEGSVVRKSGDRILVEKDGQIALDLPYHKLENVLLFGNIQVTGAAMTSMLEHGIKLSVFTRHGRFLGALSPPEAKSVELRVAQFEQYRDPATAFDMARLMVRQKITNGIDTLQRLRRRHPEAADGGVAAPLEQAVAALEAAGTIQAVDGIEGSAAREYFNALMRFNRSRFAWPGRQKHPPPDPINALLSLTYTLVMHELMGLLDACGLDPYLGFLHQLEHGRPSLALDLLEAFRHPVADRFVIGLLNQGIFGADDFRRPGECDGVWLTHEAVGRYFSEYERWMLNTPGARPSFRASIKAEVEMLARHFRTGEAWVPFSAAAVPQEQDGQDGQASAPA